ncbi:MULTISPECIES: sigma factor [Sphingobium]|jgi:DNA-directed RNA polymerase specialized sigma24 family protein|uniref:RNA polymerase sigma factor n=1 Tax=Sphingobium TaxID=165695 RepID=UPI001F0BBB6C|nr:MULTISPECIES: sigma factor [Sphingobium]
MIERAAPIVVMNKRHMSCCERLSMHVMRRQIAMLNNAAALTRLLLQERTSLLRLVESILRDRPAAEDVTQSLWFRVQRIEDDPPILNKRAYLFRLAANLAKDRIRADGRYAALFHAADTLSEEIPADMVGADTELSDRQRLAVTMRLLPQIAQAALEAFPTGLNEPEPGEADAYSYDIVITYADALQDKLALGRFLLEPGVTLP